jgi:ATP-dependent Clp protease ATP-binding subunit ClpC
MSEFKLNYKSKRSEKARIGAKFNRILLIGLIIIAILLSSLGVMMIVFQMPIGWLLIGLSAVPVMITEWYEGELRNQEIAKKPLAIDDVLAGDVLGRLSKSPTPREVAGLISMLPGGQFFVVRFGIGAKFLQDLVSDNRDDMQKVWQDAWDLRIQTGSDNISAAILLVALIKNTPNYQTLLNHLQLDIDDLVEGIKWYDYLCRLVEERHRSLRTGGLARDWSFGWTPLLNRFGINISQQIGSYSNLLFQLDSHQEALEQLIDIFSKRGRQNAVLVGPMGVGKTEIIRAFATKLIDGASNISGNLKFRQVFMLDATSLIAAAPGRGELEKLVTRILAEAYGAKNIIICLDEAQLFFEEGVGSVDIANVLLPILDAGNLRVVLTMDEQSFLRINRRNPELANVLNRISVDSATREETIDIMQDRVVLTEYQNHVTYMYQALVEAYRLSKRYIHDLAMPGKAINLMETAARYNDNGLVTADSVRQAIEKTFNVKVSVATDEDERQKLLNMEDLIHQRMINQTGAVSVVSDALRRARAGVRNQDRPIGTFLFLGPTGVGKTELAKSLAEVYFGGEDHMIRLDMNEYVNNNDASRLIADGADDANSLTARVMKQPFSVVLLDEIEKAHTNVLSMLLQMLDEGILRDTKNREVSFRDAIIIATSNAGADRIREYIGRGYDFEQFKDQFIDELISSNQFRPEFLNRFDEIAMFRPLSKSELVGVVDLMIAGVNKTLSLQKISVNVASEAKEYLAEAGYDPRLGARPIRRVVQRAVENTIARQMLSGKVGPGSIVDIDLEQIKKTLGSSANSKQLISDKNEKPEIN